MIMRVSRRRVGQTVSVDGTVRLAVADTAIAMLYRVAVLLIRGTARINVNMPNKHDYLLGEGSF